MEIMTKEDINLVTLSEMNFSCFVCFQFFFVFVFVNNELLWFILVSKIFCHENTLRRRKLKRKSKK